MLGKLDIRNAKRIHSKTQKIFQHSLGDLPYRHLGEINSETAKYASIVCENNGTDLVEGLLTEGAVLNMLAAQLKAYHENSSVVKTVSTLSKSELSRITSLGDYVLNHLDTKIAIKELSMIFQLSPKKLQIGVKQLYGETVGHYISNIRMGYAKELFLSTELNVSEVCSQIGISSQSYFSKIFKERFGMLPSVFRSKQKT